MNAGTRVLITGGAGFIGSALAAKLIHDGFDVMVVDDFVFDYDVPLGHDLLFNVSHRINHLLSGARIERCSLLEKERLGDILNAYEPSCVIHLAAIPLVAVATQRPEMAKAVLSDGLLNLLDVLRRSPTLRRFVFVSSSMVYGHFQTDMLSEDAPLNPINVYGALKLTGEILSKSYLGPSASDVVIVRPSAVYGPFDQHRRVLKKFLESALAGRSIQLNAANDHTMDFTYINDAVHGLALAATCPSAADQVFNITFGRGRSLTDLANIIRVHVPDLKTNGDQINDSDRPRRGGLSIEKARTLLNYHPEWSLERGVEAYLKHLRGSASI